MLVATRWSHHPGKRHRGDGLAGITSGARIFPPWGTHRRTHGQERFERQLVAFTTFAGAPGRRRNDQPRRRTPHSDPQGRNRRRRRCPTAHPQR